MFMYITKKKSAGTIKIKIIEDSLIHKVHSNQIADPTIKIPSSSESLHVKTIDALRS